MKKIRIYTALLTQTGSGDPTATILQNTIGYTVTPYRFNQGRYDLIIENGAEQIEWPEDTYINVGHNEVANEFVAGKWVSGGYIRVFTEQAGEYTDGLLNGTPIELRIYE